MTRWRCYHAPAQLAVVDTRTLEYQLVNLGLPEDMTTIGILQA